MALILDWSYKISWVSCLGIYFFNEDKTNLASNLVGSLVLEIKTIPMKITEYRDHFNVVVPKSSPWRWFFMLERVAPLYDLSTLAWFMLYCFCWWKGTFISCLFRYRELLCVSFCMIINLFYTPPPPQYFSISVLDHVARDAILLKLILRCAWSLLDLIKLIVN